jgi:putative ABC transport system substrate-binding protein
MRRRDVIIWTGGLVATSPSLRAAYAQAAGKVWRIGILGASARQPSNDEGFIQGMSDFGYVSGKDYLIEHRAAGGQYERLPSLADELIRANADVLLAGTGVATRALQHATRTIPIVFVGIADPIGNGFVASLPRPGSNVTGLAASYDDTAPKQLELLAAVLTKPSRIGLLVNPNSTGVASVRGSALNAARTAGLTLQSSEARTPQEIEAAFAGFTKDGIEAVVVLADGVFFGQRLRIAELALRHRLPAMFTQREYVAEGGLMSYGESQKEFYRRAATYVHKIMRGAKPADLPVEQPTRFHLVINRKTADALGVTIPALLYIFADEVIE